MIRLVGDEEAKNLVTMEEAIEAVREAFKDLSLKRAIMPLRGRIDVGGKGDFLAMPSYVPSLGALSIKLVTVYPDNASRGLPLVNAVLISLDADTGVPELVIEANYLTAIRTGAASGVATDFLAREDSRSLAVIGCGVQGRMQALAVSKVRNLDTIVAYSRNPANVKRYVEEISRMVDAEVMPAKSAEEAVKDADIVCTATTSTQPVLKREWIRDGTHINAIGSYKPDSRELDTDTVTSSKLVVDSLEACLSEAGDLIIPIREGRLKRESVHAEIGEIVAGIKPGREYYEEITVFKSVGLAIQDAAMASLVAKKLFKKKS